MLTKHEILEIEATTGQRRLDLRRAYNARLRGGAWFGKSNKKKVPENKIPTCDDCIKSCMRKGLEKHNPSRKAPFRGTGKIVKECKEECKDPVCTRR